MTTLRRDTEACVVVIVTGEVDLMTADRLGVALERALVESNGRVVVVDLREVTFLASSGLKVLITATQRATELAEPLRLVVDENRPVVRPIEVTGLEQFLTLYDSYEQAVEPC